MTPPHPRIPCPKCHGARFIRIHPKHRHTRLCPKCHGVGWDRDQQAPAKRPTKRSGVPAHAKPENETTRTQARMKGM